jgi:hypothetical protein
MMFIHERIVAGYQGSPTLVACSHAYLFLNRLSGPQRHAMDCQGVLNTLRDAIAASIPLNDQIVQDDYAGMAATMGPIT